MSSPSSILCFLAGLLPAIALAAEPAPRPSREKPLVAAERLYRQGSFITAEERLREALSAIKRGRLDRNRLGRCLRLLTDVYRALGRNEDALRSLKQYRRFVRQVKALHERDRQRIVESTTIEAAQLLGSLQRFKEAEAVLQDGLTKIGDRSAPGHLVRGLPFQIELAKLAKAQGDQQKARQQWSEVAKDAKEALRKMDGRQRSSALRTVCMEALATSYVATENYPAAIKVKLRLLALQRKRQDKFAEVRTRKDLGALYVRMKDYARAETALETARKLQRELAPDSVGEAELLTQLAAVLNSHGRRPEAAERWDQAATIYQQRVTQQQESGGRDQLVIQLMDRLQDVYQQRGRYADAIQVNQQLLALKEKALGQRHPQTYHTKSDLGALYASLSDYQRAKPLLEDVVNFWRCDPTKAPLALARGLNDLAIVERAIGSFADAQSLLESSINIRSQHLRPDDLRLAYAYSNLASVISAQGKYAQAIVLFDQAIQIYRERGRSADESLSSALLNVAMTYKSQGQIDKAIETCLESLRVYQREIGQDAPGAVGHFNALASLYISKGQLEKASQFNQRAFEICRRGKRSADPVAATALHHKATIEYLRNELDAAERHWHDALRIQEATSQWRLVARTLNYLAKVATLRGEPDRAVPLYRRALAMQETVQAYPTIRYLTECGLAEILYAQGKQDEALALITKAIERIETPRAETVGAETERADQFARFGFGFDLLVSWSLNSERIDDAFFYAECGRNRTFLDQLRLSGVDLRETLAGPRGKKLQEQENALRIQLATIQTRAQAAAQDADTTDSLRQLKGLNEEWKNIKKEYATVWREIRNASPLYRKILTQGSPAESVAAVRQYIARTEYVMLRYVLGENSSVLFVIGQQEPGLQAHKIEIPKPVADAFSVKSGPLTRPIVKQIVGQYLADLRSRGGGRGLGDAVTSKKGVRVDEQSAMLAEILLPRMVRKTVQQLAPRGVIIVPDGALHQLPFEALRLDSSPRYLLDVFPPIAYAPSASILLNLDARSARQHDSVVSVVTVGNPHYLEDQQHAARSVSELTREAYLELGGRLPRLPETSKECLRVAKAFSGKRVMFLEGEKATEQNVRREILGRHYIHLAAHGFVDQAHRNLFGAIALTPPTNGQAHTMENDGFLSVREIHNLPLSQCELAVLSACQTNVGPTKVPQEAGSSMAQAFLAAGCKRVLCSHWNVHDSSTAEMMGAFFEGVAQSLERSESVPYAAVLHQARKKIRGNPKWNDPYYWAPLVLVGPPQ